MNRWLLVSLVVGISVGILALVVVAWPRDDAYVVIGTVTYLPWHTPSCYLTVEQVVSEPSDLEKWRGRLTPGVVITLSPTEGMQLADYNGVRGTATVLRASDGYFKVVSFNPV